MLQSNPVASIGFNLAIYRRRSLVPTLALAALFGLCPGCGTGEPANSQATFEEVMEVMDTGDYAAAEEAWSSALKGGGLGAGHYGDALIYRAACRAKLGDFDAAHADLDMAGEMAPHMDRVLAARAFVYTQQGKESEASAAIKKARRINRDVDELDL